MKKCQCGSTKFIVTETTTYAAILDESDGKLGAFNANTQITEIICAECNKDFLEFNECVIFN